MTTAEATEVEWRLDLNGPMDIHLPHGTSDKKYDLTLQAGQINEDAESYFGRAYCHWLAGAMHCLTGWDTVTLDGIRDGVWKPIHTAIVTPSGQPIDIFGTHTSREALVEKYIRLTGAPVRHRSVPAERMPGEVMAFDTGRGSSTWWAADLGSDAAVATFLHFARLVLRRAGHADALHGDGYKPAPPPTRIPAPREETRPTPTPTNTARSSAMGIEEVRAGITEAEQRGQTAAQRLAAAQEELQSATDLLRQITQGTADGDITTAIGQLQDVVTNTEQLPGRIFAATDAAMAYGGRL